MSGGVLKKKYLTMLSGMSADPGGSIGSYFMQHLSLLINDDGLELCLPSTTTTSDGDPRTPTVDEHGGGVGVVVALWGFTKVEEWESGRVGHTKGYVEQNNYIIFSVAKYVH